MKIVESKIKKNTKKHSFKKKKMLKNKINSSIIKKDNHNSIQSHVTKSITLEAKDNKAPENKSIVLDVSTSFSDKNVFFNNETEIINSLNISLIDMKNIRFKDFLKVFEDIDRSFQADLNLKQTLPEVENVLDNFKELIENINLSLKRIKNTIIALYEEHSSKITIPEYDKITLKNSLDIMNSCQYNLELAEISERLLKASKYVTNCRQVQCFKVLQEIKIFY